MNPISKRAATYKHLAQRAHSHNPSLHFSISNTVILCVLDCVYGAGTRVFEEIMVFRKVSAAMLYDIPGYVPPWLGPIFCLCWRDPT